ncbi:MAG TPA: hypothetical protein VKR32_04885 [Puia sp.]|nr:hypothetical protein [Puia sp.]
MNVKIDSLDIARKLRHGDVIFQADQQIYRVKNISNDFITLLQIGTPPISHLFFLQLKDLIAEDWFQFQATESAL